MALLLRSVNQSLIRMEILEILSLILFKDPYKVIIIINNNKDLIFCWLMKLMYFLVMIFMENFILLMDN